ncbi:unnamed protein product [Ilex paraguariensis]|uniref:BED-type domain-containing protein n=1 Tax=Ilex paraguariensis TaxID=185542 RepID=A0ABC8SS14_9AQUA
MLQPPNSEERILFWYGGEIEGSIPQPLQALRALRGEHYNNTKIIQLKDMVPTARMEGNTTLVDATEVIDDPMETNEDEKSKNKKLGKSKVWNHFKLLEMKKGKVRRAECKYCHKVYQCDSKKHGTSSSPFT